MRKKSTTEQFIITAKLIHGNVYNYDKVVYEKNNKKVEIVCSLHGSFFQNPNNHLNGDKCSKCAGLKVKLTLQEFIKKSNLKHKNFYSYDKSKYINYHTNLIITCPIHGDFKQSPSSHIKGFGCLKCSYYRVSKPEIEFLNYIGVEHLNRQICICQKKVDGFVPETNTIYEFLGDYWHGNPERFCSNKTNSHTKKSFGQLYEETLKKFNELKLLGYNLKYIWELDWHKFKTGKMEMPNILNY